MCFLFRFRGMEIFRIRFYREMDIYFDSGLWDQQVSDLQKSYSSPLRSFTKGAVIIYGWGTHVLQYLPCT